jgi:hypothetical protein
LIVTAGVDFARKAAAQSNKSLRKSPPPFPPTSETWPRIVVLSIMCCQSSVRPRSTNVCSRASHTPCLSVGTAHRRSSTCCSARACRARAANPSHMKHAVEKTPVVASWPSPASTLRWQQRADQFQLGIRQVPSIHDCSPKSSLESEIWVVGILFCQHCLVDWPERKGPN